MTINSGELLFVKSVKDGIPNRDPLNDSDARRLFSEEDGRISLSDVSIKRDIRDYVLAKFPDGRGNNYVFVREERNDEGKLLGRENLAKQIKRMSANENSKMRDVLIAEAFDVRTFGIVYSVKNETFKLTGPVQFGWAHSLHPVETQYVQGTVVMPSKDIDSNKSSKTKTENQGEQPEESSKEATQGTIWTSYMTPFAVFCAPAVINATLALQTEMKDDDLELMLEALWNGTKHRQARGRGLQQPLLLIHVEYKDPLYRIGYLEESIKLADMSVLPKGLEDVVLDVSQLTTVFERNSDKIARIRCWTDPRLKLTGMWEGETCPLW